MSALSRLLRDGEGGKLMFWCPGCDGVHSVGVGEGPGPRWTYNGNPDKPTFSPSVLLQSEQYVPPVNAKNHEEWKRAPWKQTKVPMVCHSFITDGRIQFLGDCTHALAGQTVDLAEWNTAEEVEQSKAARA